MSTRRDVRLFAAMLLAACCIGAHAQQRHIAPGELRSGITFASREIQAMQQDDFANPGMLWVERGRKAWNEPYKGNSCAGCHGDAKESMKGVATRYPLVDRASGRLLNLEARILQCRSERQGAPPLRYESDELLALTAYVAHQSRGMPISVAIDGPARAHFEAGQALFHQRIGQVDLSCANCHDEHWGKTLMAEKISQGHPTAYPIYRTQWQVAGSLERRLRACLSGVRAEMLPYGAPDYRDLELYLAWRAQGLPIETPGVRR